MALSLPFGLSRRTRKNKSATRGAAAVEFALVAPAFIFLATVSFDLGIAIAIQAVLNNAAKDAARLIQVNPNVALGTFLSQINSDVAGLVPSASVQYYVQSSASFGSMSPVTSTHGNLPDTYSPGVLGLDVVVQVGYNRPTIIPWTMVALNGSSTTINTSNLLLSTIVFQNEPP